MTPACVLVRDNAPARASSASVSGLSGLRGRDVNRGGLIEEVPECRRAGPRMDSTASAALGEGTRIDQPVFLRPSRMARLRTVW